MLLLQRREEIKSILLEKKSVTVGEIAAHFDVSAETIRRDFEALEEDGFLSKTYGGAVLQNRVRSQASHQVLSSLFVDAKRRIAKKGSELLRPDESIFIDFSTTALQLCGELQDMRLTVMSNSHNVLGSLAGNPKVNLLSTGGNFDRNSFSYFGRNAVRFLSSYHLDTAFVSCCTLSMEKGLSDRNEDEAEIRRTVIENADRVVLLADHTKFNRTSFVHTCGFDRLSVVITDEPLSADWSNFLKQRKVSVYECPAD